MRKNTPVYCRLKLYGNLREFTGNKSNTFCLYERKNTSKYSTIITLTKSVWLCVVCSHCFTLPSEPAEDQLQQQGAVKYKHSLRKLKILCMIMNWYCLVSHAYPRPRHLNTGFTSETVNIPFDCLLIFIFGYVKSALEFSYSHLNT